MSIKPILFNGEMVKAILDGRKTQTRRVIKPQPQRSDGNWGRLCWPVGRVKHPPFATGDTLWVRETWDNIPVSQGGHFRFGGKYYYKADGDLRPDGWRGNWHPSIHMPKDAARIFLRITAVWVERLRDIDVDEVPMEGVLPLFSGFSGPIGNREDYYKAASTIKTTELDRYGWDANPWVWVIEFERVERPASW